MVFGSGVVSVVIILLYKSKGETTKYRNFRVIRLLSVVGKIYAGILVKKKRVRRVTGYLIEDEEGGFRAGRG